MPQVTESAVMSALGTVQEPELGGDLVTRNMVRDLRIDGAAVAFTIELTTPACPLKDEIESRVHAALDPIGVESVELTWGASVRRLRCLCDGPDLEISQAASRCQTKPYL